MYFFIIGKPKIAIQKPNYAENQRNNTSYNTTNINSNVSIYVHSYIVTDITVAKINNEKEHNNKQRRKIQDALCTVQLKLWQWYQKQPYIMMKIIKPYNNTDQIVNLIKTVVAPATATVTNATHNNQKQEVTNVVNDKVSGKLIQYITSSKAQEWISGSGC